MLDSISVSKDNCDDRGMILNNTYLVFLDGMVLHLERLVDQVLLDLQNINSYNGTMKSNFSSTFGGLMRPQYY